MGALVGFWIFLFLAAGSWWGYRWWLKGKNARLANVIENVDFHAAGSEYAVRKVSRGYEATVTRGGQTKTYRSSAGVNWYSEDGKSPSYETESRLYRRIKASEMWR